MSSSIPRKFLCFFDIFRFNTASFSFIFHNPCRTLHNTRYFLYREYHFIHFLLTTYVLFSKITSHDFYGASYDHLSIYFTIIIFSTKKSLADMRAQKKLPFDFSKRSFRIIVFQKRFSRRPLPYRPARGAFRPPASAGPSRPHIPIRF